MTKINNKRRVQIGIIGSTNDLKYVENAKKFAYELGEMIAKEGHILMFGAEKDLSSLPTIAALSAVKVGGMTVGITYDKGRDIFDNDSASIVIVTGLVRGGGREMSFILSCDVVIAISGGSGTLTEIAIAYQAGIPVITTRFGGWSEKLAGSFLDDRKRYKYLVAKTPSEALRLAVSSISK